MSVIRGDLHPEESRVILRPENVAEPCMRCGTRFNRAERIDRPDLGLGKHEVRMTCPRDHVFSHYPELVPSDRFAWAPEEWVWFTRDDLQQAG
jgi:hypothetical protein